MHTRDLHRTLNISPSPPPFAVPTLPDLTRGEVCDGREARMIRLRTLLPVFCPYCCWPHALSWRKYVCAVCPSAARRTGPASAPSSCPPPSLPLPLPRGGRGRMRCAPCPALPCPDPGPAAAAAAAVSRGPLPGRAQGLDARNTSASVSKRLCVRARAFWLPSLHGVTRCGAAD